MTREEFTNYIQSIGFKEDVKGFTFIYKEYILVFNGDGTYLIYSSYNNNIVLPKRKYNQLINFNKIFIKEVRSIKLKKILG